MGDRNGVLEIDGRRLAVSRLTKVLYPLTGTTKGDVLEYFVSIADILIPHVRDRPITRKRWPDGVEATPFFTKNLERGAPAWILRRKVRHTGHDTTYPLADSAAELAWLAQNAALELHVPQWRFDDCGVPGNPDRLVFDLDPGPGVGLPECAEVARLIRTALGAAGRELVPVTSGSKGIHLYLPLDGDQDADTVSAAARQLAHGLAAANPDLIVAMMARSARAGKVFIDWSQNNRSKTTIAPYSLRGRDRPTVAAPRHWDELDDPGLAQLDYRQVLNRVAEHGDPMAALGVPRSSGTVPAGQERLSTYRSKRRPGRTPEPMPQVRDASSAAGPTAPADGRFVVQEHHARRLHWDFRLERDGVLVSWAVPRGLPTGPDENRLAVQTEDHPLEYGSFAGQIPAGEYGAGAVSIWDSGTYRSEKWRDDEIIVVLAGSRANGRFALIRTHAPNWLLHKTRTQPLAVSGTAERTGMPGTDAGSGMPDATWHDADPAPRPMLASAGTLADVSGAEWRFEGKWDGIRALAALHGPVLELTSRGGQDLTGAYPEVGELVTLLSGHQVRLDGEIVALDAQGRTDFGLLQQRSRRDRQIPLAYLVFDLLHIDGHSLLDKPYESRRALLEALQLRGRCVRVPDQVPGPARHAVEVARRAGWEGIVAKRADSRYEPGRRSHSWIKIKFVDAVEAVIIGWRPGNGSRATSFGSLLLAVRHGGGLRYAGRVGTGFTEAVLADLTRRLAPLRVATMPPVADIPAPDAADAAWVRPELVAEVSHAGWTPEGRLWHPVWRGLRTDKGPAEIGDDAVQPYNVPARRRQRRDHR